MAVLTVYPSLDGRYGNTTDSSWATLKAANGNTYNVANSPLYLFRLDAAATTDQFDLFYRSGAKFDTSALGAGATISAATLSFYIQTKYDDLGITPSLNIYSATIGSDATSYQSMGTTQYATTKAFSDFTVGSFEDFTLNSSGIAAISKTGDTEFGVRNTQYDVGSSTPSWTASVDTRLYASSVEQVGTTQDPKLVITYTTATNVTVTPSVLAANISLQSPTVSAIQNVSVSPSVLAAVLSIPTPVISTSGNVAVYPNALGLNLSLPTPTVSAIQNVNISPSVLGLNIDVLNPTIFVSGDVTVSPSTLNLSIDLVRPNIVVAGSISVNINTINRNDHIDWKSLKVVQNLTSQVDKCTFQIKSANKAYTPAVGDDIEVLDGATAIFGGEIVRVSESNLSIPDGVIYNVECADYEFGLQNILFAESYENETIENIIADIFDNYVTGYTYTNVSCTFEIEKIVFNNITVTQALKRLAEIVKYEFYVDPDKDLHFFQKFTNSAPFDLTDTDNYSIKGSLDIKFDGSQIANAVKVRGGEYDGSTFEEVLTAGDGQLSFKTKNKMSNLAVWLDTGSGYVAQTVGIEFVDDFADGFDVLQNYQDQSFRFENGLTAGDLVKYSGNPKVRVLVESEDSASIAEYGRREKMIQDTSIEDNTTARQRAKAELGAYKDEMVEGRFQTYTSGLRSGQLIKITNTKFDVDTSFLIKQVTFKTFTSKSYIYQASLTTARKYELVEILMRLIEADPLQADDSEVAEKLKSDIRTITIGESIARQISQDDDATIEFTENIQDDPLGAGVEPTWVLAPYFPSSITDTKRVGLLNRSLKVY